MAQRQLNELTDLSHLLAAATNVVVADICEIAFLIFTLDGLALGVNDSVLGDNAVLGRVGLDDLELDAPELVGER